MKEERAKISFRVKVFSSVGSLTDEFTVPAETKKDAILEVRRRLTAEGIDKEATFIIS